MAENNSERWSRHLLFETPAPPQKAVAPVEDRSWMPQPSAGAVGGTDWHKGGKWRESWRAPTEWAQTAEPKFHAQIMALETELSGLERTVPAYSPKLASVRSALSRHYWMLNRLFDAHIKKLPFTRY